MARYRFKSSIKPQGWTGESHRHYLAAKGIRTNNSYFVNNSAKGNRNVDEFDSKRKSLQAQGYNANEQERLFGIPQKPRSSTKFQVPDRDVVAESLSPQLVPAEQIPVEEVQQATFEGTEPESEPVLQESISTGIESDVAESFDRMKQPIVATDPTAELRTADAPFFLKSRYVL